MNIIVIFKFNVILFSFTYQGSAVSILSAAWGKARASPGPLDIEGSEGWGGAAPLPLTCAQETGERGGDEEREQEGEQGGEGGRGGHGQDRQTHVAADRGDIIPAISQSNFVQVINRKKKHIDKA